MFICRQSLAWISRLGYSFSASWNDTERGGGGLWCSSLSWELFLLLFVVFQPLVGTKLGNDPLNRRNMIKVGDSLFGVVCSFKATTSKKHDARRVFGWESKTILGEGYGGQKLDNLKGQDLDHLATSCKTTWQSRSWPIGTQAVKQSDMTKTKECRDHDVWFGFSDSQEPKDTSGLKSLTDWIEKECSISLTTIIEALIIPWQYATNCETEFVRSHCINNLEVAL